jgi:thioesterase domain-containing protein
VIAADLARRLRDAGETVELLFLLDPTARRSTGRLYPFWLLRDAALIAVTAVLGRLGYWAANRARGHYVRRVYHAALTRHRPDRIAVPALVLTTLEESMLPGHHPWWRDALDGASIETVREDHLALQSDPAALLAWTARLSVALSALQDPSERP